MALPKSKYSDPKHTPGGEFALNGKEYTGWYITTYRGENYTGKTYGINSKLLTSISENAPGSSPTFIEEPIQPNSYDKKEGVLKRYFVQKIQNLKIIEVSKLRYIEFNKVSGYKRATLDWRIKGPAENQSINGYTYFGAAHVNKVNTQALESTIKGITTYIKDYSEFVE